MEISTFFSIFFIFFNFKKVQFLCYLNTFKIEKIFKKSKANTNTHNVSILKKQNRKSKDEREGGYLWMMKKDDPTLFLW